MAFGIFNQTVTGWRFGLGSYVRGEYQPPTPEPISIQTSIQPASGSQLERLPEGLRSNATYALRATQEIREAVEDGHGADIFEFMGRRWQVVNLRVWRNGILPHYEALVQRVQYEPDNG